MGADTLRSFTVVPGFGGYFRSVTGVAEFTSQSVRLSLRKSALVIGGEGLEVAKYFEQDVLIRGDIKEIRFE